MFPAQVPVRSLTILEELEELDSVGARLKYLNYSKAQCTLQHNSCSWDWQPQLELARSVVLSFLDTVKRPPSQGEL